MGAACEGSKPGTERQHRLSYFGEERPVKRLHPATVRQEKSGCGDGCFRIMCAWAAEAEAP